MADIDRLTVGVGLNSEEFQAGIDRIMQGIEGLRTETTEAAEGMGASFATMGESIAGLALKFGGLFLAIRGISDVIGYFKDLSGELANLGFAGKYLGQSSVQLSRWGEVARLAGGHAEDAIAAVQGLQSAIFGLEYQGQMSQNLLMLNRLRVAYLDPQGHMLPIETIAMNAAKALQEQLPGKANEAMRVQWAAQIFGPGGIANAVGGGVEALRKFYGESSKDQKSITQRAIDAQMHLNQSITRLSYDIKSQATDILDKLTPTIQKLIDEIRNGLIPTIDEAITDLDDFLHPTKLVDKAMSGKGVGSLWNPIHFFEAMGIGLGIRAGQVHDWWMKHIHNQSFAGASTEAIPAQVQSRLDPGTNLQALRYLHYEAGGDIRDPTWSKAIVAYASLAQKAGGPAAYVKYVQQTGNATVPSRLPSIATPSATRPSVSHKTDARVTITNLNVNAPNAKDANGVMKASRSAWEAAANRAMERKLLAAQADPGMQ